MANVVFFEQIIASLDDEFRLLYVVDSEDGRSDEDFVLVLQGDTHARSVLLIWLKLRAWLIIFKVVMAMYDEIHKLSVVDIITQLYILSYYGCLHIN